MSAPDHTAQHAAQRAVLDRVGSLEREQAVLYAKQARARAEMVRLWGSDQGMLLELAGTARIGQDKAGGQLGRGERLVAYFPVALGLLELGVMRVGTVQILLAVSKNCSAAVQQLLDQRISERICPLDAVDARALIAASIPELEAEVDEQAQRERHERARANRGVWVFPVEDGMARIGAELDQPSARRWSLDLEELVRAAKVLDDRDGVKRTQAQRRADVFAQLPSRLLALVDAATRGELEALLAQVSAERAARSAARLGADHAAADDALREDSEHEDSPSDSLRADSLRADSERADSVVDIGGSDASGPVPAPRASCESADAPADATTDPTTDAISGATSGAAPFTDSDAGSDADGDVDGDVDSDLQLDLDLDLDAGAGAGGVLPRERASGSGAGLGSALPWWAWEREELLIGLLRLPVRNPVMMHVHTGMTTLLDLDQRSGWLEGIGPVPALQARMLLPSATLRRVGVDERTGIPLGVDPPAGPAPPWAGEYDPPPALAHVDHPDPVVMAAAVVQRNRLLALLGPMYLTDRAEPQHDPSTALRALTRLRDQRCDGPGCPRTASACDLDHETDYALGGQTALWNLTHRSVRCHIVKHHGWHVVHDHHTGISTWTSPAGSIYQRLSPWQPPPELPEDLQLPAPHLVQPLDLPPDRHDPGCDDRPLWRDPEPPRPRAPRRPRGIDPNDLDEHGNVIPPPPPKPGDGDSWDDGPPPF